MMRYEAVRLVLVALALYGALAFPGAVVAQQAVESGYPSLTRLYSIDGRESLTASCMPIDGAADGVQISCKFMNVRFRLPDLDQDEVLAAMETPRRKLQQEGHSSESAERELANQLKAAIAPACVGYRQLLHDSAGMGPKSQEFAKQVVTACEANDPLLVVKHIGDRKKRTCGIWVDEFDLEFTRVRPGQWIYRQETPGTLTKVLKVYELTGEGYSWTLSETRVPTEGSDETPSREVWKSDREGVYELPCVFIEHDLIQTPL